MLEFATCEKELEHTDFVAFVCQLDGGLKHVVQFEFSVGIERVLLRRRTAGVLGTVVAMCPRRRCCFVNVSQVARFGALDDPSTARVFRDSLRWRSIIVCPPSPEAAGSQTPSAKAAGDSCIDGVSAFGKYFGSGVRRSVVCGCDHPLFGDGDSLGPEKSAVSKVEEVGIDLFASNSFHGLIESILGQEFGE